MSLPSLVSDRDLIQHVKVLTDDSTRTTYVVALPATHPGAPERSKVIRAETRISISILRPDGDDPKSSIITTVTHTDLKGLLPDFVINHGVMKTGDDWRKSMTTFYHDVYVKEKQ